MRKQETPLDQKIDSTVTFVKWEMYRIVMRANDLTDLDKYSHLYSAEKWFIRIRFSKDESKENRFKIDAILEE